MVKFKEFNHANLKDSGSYKSTKLTDAVELTEKNVKTLLSFSTKSVIREFIQSVAYEIDDMDYLLSHTILMYSSSPSTVLALFDPNLVGSLMVIDAIIISTIL